MTTNGNTSHSEMPEQQEPGQGGLSRRGFVKGAAAAGAVGAAGAAGWLVFAGGGEEKTAAVGVVFRARKAVAALPRDPLDQAWAAVTPLQVPLLPQHMTTPRSTTATIDQILARVLHNGSEVAFQLEWIDDEVDDVEAIQRFRDSVAVQLPVDPKVPTSVMMGEIGRPVHILHWRASWQSEMANGGRQVRTAFPNAVNEVTPETVLGEEAARVFYPALAVGNPMADRNRKSAVEELVAEGFGTLTPHRDQRAEGRGVLTEGGWAVVIVVPMSGGKNQAKLKSGDSTPLAFAAWDGGAGNRGARKQWSNWVTLELEA
jgi:DMSO reductase family type II enzyme heme b subunit